MHTVLLKGKKNVWLGIKKKGILTSSFNDQWFHSTGQRTVYNEISAPCFVFPLLVILSPISADQKTLCLQWEWIQPVFTSAVGLVSDAVDSDKQKRQTLGWESSYFVD